MVAVPDDFATENNVPDIDEIELLLDFAERRDEAASRQQLDRDHQVLASAQAEVNSLVGQDLAETVMVNPKYQQESLMRLLQRIENAMTANRSRRHNSVRG